MSRRIPTVQELSLNICRENLQNSQSELFEGSENINVQIDGDAEVTRMWRFGTLDLLSQCRYYLHYFTDESNTDQQRYVKDLKVGNRVFEGIWRQAFTRTIQRTEQGETYYILAQTLRQGWATSIDWTEARIKEEKLLPGNSEGSGNEASDDPEIYYFIDFPNFSPFSVDAALRGLATTLSSVTVQGQSLGDNLHLVTGTHERQDDASSVITLKIARPQYLLNGYSSWGGGRQSDDKYLWNVPKDLAETILDANKAQGVTARPSYRGELVDIVFSSTAMDTMNAKYDSLETELRTEDTVIYENKSVPLDAPTRSQGEIYRASNSFNGDGGYDARLQYSASYAKTTEFDSQSSAFKSAHAWLYKNSRTTISVPTNTGSGVYRASQSENEDGTYDGQLQYVYGTGSGQHEFKSSISDLFETTETIYKSSPTPVVARDDVVGGIYQATNAITDEGLYNGRTIYRGSIDKNVLFSSMTSNFRKRSTWIYRNSRTAIEAPAHTGAGVYIAQQSMNEDQTYNGQMQFTESNGNGIYSFDSFHGHLNDRLSVIYKNSNTGVAAPADALGYIYQASNSIAEDGTYNSNLLYTTSNPQNIYFTWTTRNGTSSSWIYKNQTSFPSTAPLTNATNNDISSTINADGTYDVSMKAVPFAGSGGTDFWAEYEFAHKHYRDKDGQLLGIYHYQTTDIDKARDWALAAFDDATVGGRNLIDTDFRFAGKDRWVGIYVSKIS